MADDNRLPTNQSQLDIKAELTAIKTAIQQLYAMQNKADLTTIAPAENQIASATHAVDDIFTYNGKLYQVTSAIDIGDDITNKITEIATTSYVNPTRMNHIEDGIYDASTATGTEYSSGVSVKDKIDDLSTFNLVSVTPGANVTSAFAKVLELANAYIISGGFTLTGNISPNDTIMTGISFNGGGSLMCSCPYSSSGIMTFLNGTIISNAGLNSNANAYYFSGIVLK